MKHNGSKNRFLTCFRPEEVDIDSMLDPKPSAHHRSSSRHFSCIPVADHHHKHDEKKFSEQEILVVPPKRKLSKHTQYKNRLSHDCFGSNRSYSELYPESSSIGDHEKSMLRLESMNIKEVKARELSLSRSSPSSALPKPKDLSMQETNNKENLEKKKMFKCVGILVILVMSLAVTVFCGKWKGIFLTSMWLCFFPLLVEIYRRVKGDCEIVVTRRIQKPTIIKEP